MPALPLPRLALLALVLAPACADHKGPPFQLQVAHRAVDGRCVPVNGPPIQDPRLGAANITHVRMSALVHAQGDPTGSFACDRVFPVGAMQSSFRVPLGMGSNQTIDLYIEGFQQNSPTDPLNLSNGPFRRVATGALQNLKFDLSSPTALPIVLYPTQTFRCADSRLSRARAFHTATLLPDGQVLIYGGVVADPNDPAVEQLDGQKRMYLVGTAELYDPSSGKFTAVTDGTGMNIGRAFHHAAVIGAAAPFQVLLVGGLTTAMGADPHSEVLAPNTGLGVGRIYPVDLANGAAKANLLTSAAPADIITIDSARAVITSHAPQPAYMSAAFQAALELPNFGGLAVADGIEFNPANSNQPLARQQLAVQTTITSPPRVGSTMLQRMGATLSPIGGDSALLWGGGTNPSDQLGEYIVGLRAGTLMSQRLFSAMGGVPMTQFHTATVLDSDGTGTRVLIAGGFAVEGTHLNRQTPSADQAVHLVNVTTTGMVDQVTPVLPVGNLPLDLTCTNAMRYRPAGYQAAALLRRADNNLRVLITGGAPSFVADSAAKTCQDCQSTLGDAICSIDQAVIYSRSSGLQLTDEPLQVGRFGHTATVLNDGDVLIVGGINRPADGSSPRTVGDAEVYNPRALVPPYDATMPKTALDADDPLHDPIGSLKLVRAPGQQALDPTMQPMDPTKTTPYKTCADF